jgi:ABC-type bacteriocin/lantibiotic exporter with double-glycine peptidase domain
VRVALLALLACGACAGSFTRLPAGVQEPGWVVVPGAQAYPQRELRDCGAAALATVLHYWEPALDADAVRALTGPSSGKGIAAERLRAVARQRGLQAYLVSATPADLEREIASARPVLVGLVKVRWGRAYTHYQVITGIHPARGLVLSADPERGWSVMPAKELLAEWAPARHLALVTSR